ncbi:MAG TPA: thioredoxin domain-containing protein [Edaphocola sp.]|nr:thioredoxin domain-containing protein [Edaphocola sp.]
MKKINLILMMLFLPFLLGAQGIIFEEGSFKDILAKAKKENKIVYMDIYTTWCGPCKMMAAQLFPTKEAGDLYNPNFINFKIDAEKGEGIDLATRYKVEGYPTNLFLDSEGNVLYRVMGAGDLNWFLNNANNAIAESKDPISWEEYGKEFSKGNTKKDFLEKYILKCKRLDKNNDNALNVYVDKYMKKNISDAQLQFLLDNNLTTDNKAYSLIEKNKKRVNEFKKEEAPNYFDVYTPYWFMGTIKKYAELKDDTKYKKILADFLKKTDEKSLRAKWYYLDQFYKFSDDDKMSRDYESFKANELTKLSNAEYQAEDELIYKQIREQVKTQFASQGLEGDALDKQTDQYIASQGSLDKMFSMNTVNDLNRSAWSIYEQKDKALVSQAIGWASKAISLIKGQNAESEAAIIDTYAHLIYLNGETQKAIIEEQKAIELLKSSKMEDAQEGVEEMENTIEKMKAGTL